MTDSIKVFDLKGNRINFSFPKPTKKLAKIVLSKQIGFKVKSNDLLEYEKQQQNM